MIDMLKEIRRKLLRHFKMRPIHKVISLLQKNDYLKMNSTLEVFGYNGEYHTLDYIQHVKQLDIWEIAKDCEVNLKRNLPNANVKITNSYEEIKTTNKVFDTIIIDNHQGIFGDDKCEHFEIIENCFSKLSDKSVLITNVIPDILVSKYDTPIVITAKHIERRKTFYSHPTGTSITKSYFEDFYVKMSRDNGFITNHVFLVKRNYLMTYLVLCLEKNK
jgi:hypothetical protein